MLCIKDEYYKEPRANLEINLRSIILRSTLQMLTDEEVQELNDIFHKLVDDSNKFDTSTTSAKQIKGCFRTLNNDKEAVKRLDFIMN